MTGKEKRDKDRRLFIDADGFPHMEAAIEIAESFSIAIVAVGNMTQNLGRLEDLEGVQIIEVSDGMDATDFAIINHMQKGDIVLTGDTGLASLVLGKGGTAIDIRGNPYREQGMNERLLARHIAKKIRRRGGKTGGHKKITSSDREKFAEKLVSFLNKI